MANSQEPFPGGVAGSPVGVTGSRSVPVDSGGLFSASELLSVFFSAADDAGGAACFVASGVRLSAAFLSGSAGAGWAAGWVFASTGAGGGNTCELPDPFCQIV